MVDQDYPSDIRRYANLAGRQLTASWSASRQRLLHLAATLEDLSMHNESRFTMMAALQVTPEDVMLLHDIAACAEGDTDHRVRALTWPLRRGAAAVAGTLGAAL
jgi:uncharacterized protein (DUF1778 family)